MIDDATLTDDDRHAITCRTGTSHTAFIDTSTADTPTVRFFTSAGELTNCGHGTIAAASRPAAPQLVVGTDHAVSARPLFSTAGPTAMSPNCPAISSLSACLTGWDQIHVSTHRSLTQPARLRPA
ncbi:PhzF family phenazine biosynthesis protein [Micromonospora sp. NPDC005553]|uniref:PhzF family phenazine biosynthesis protein n=1 Tax=Micromonospora sp. NPDC005553 TaxID=3364232 RepID=UPI003693EB1D